METQNVSLRRNWNHITSTLPPGAERIAVLLDEGLAELETTGDYQEPRLLALVGEATTLADRLLSPDESRQLSHRLQRGVYEYLLAIDAVSREPLLEAEHAPRPPLDETEPLGDRAAVGHRQPPDWKALREEIAANGDDHVSEAPVSRGFSLFKRKQKHAPEPQPAAEEPQTATASETDSAELATHPSAAGSQQRSAATHDGFHLGHPEDLGIEETPGGETPATAEQPEIGLATRAPEAEFVAAPPDAEFAAAPEPEFGSAPSEDEFAAAPPETELGAPPPEPEVQGTPPPAGIPAKPGYSIRETTVEAVPEPPAAASPAVAELPDVVPDLVEKDLDIAEARGDIEDRLRRKKCDEAASMLQQLAQEVGGREVAELAVDAGDRCRGLGKRRAATNCYLAAARSDPVYTVPLSCLADICLDDQDIELAVSYLERVARLSHIRGDTREALRIYRKIATIAPYREDILELLVRAQTQSKIAP